MADKYVDSVSGSNADNGTTQALAWATIEYALESGGLVAGDKVWVRRNHSEIPTTDITGAYDATESSPISVIGWPRAAIANTIITEASWTNGSTTVDLIVGITASRVQQQGRFATAPDGKKYLITRVVDSNTVIIADEYAGATVTGTSGKFSIDADEDYSTRPTDVDGWDSDSDTLALIDFNSTNFQLLFNGVRYHILKNLELRESTDLNGIIIITGAHGAFSLWGVLIKQSNNTEAAQFNSGYIYLRRVIIEGSGAGTSQAGIYGTVSSRLHLEDCAIYNMGSSGFNTIAGNVFLDNVNIGVEQANGSDDLNLNAQFGRVPNVRGKNVKLGGTNGYVNFNPYATANTKVRFENYQKVLGDHKTWFAGGSLANVDVGDTNAPSAASTSGNTTDLIEILPNDSGYEFIEEWAVEVFVHEFEVDTASKTYTYYIQNNLGVTINAAAKDDLYLKAEYVDSHNDPTAYTMGEVFSAETSIAQRADATDWDSLSVTVQSAVASKVRITLCISKYVASGGIYVDPLPVIT